MFLQNVHWSLLYIDAQLRRVSDGDSRISFLICHGTCIVAPHLDCLSETTLMWGHDLRGGIKKF